jgi:hypothetical protein
MVFEVGGVRGVQLVGLGSRQRSGKSIKIANVIASQRDRLTARRRQPGLTHWRQMLQSELTDPCRRYSESAWPQSEAHTTINLDTKCCKSRQRSKPPVQGALGKPGRWA